MTDFNDPFLTMHEPSPAPPTRSERAEAGDASMSVTVGVNDKVEPSAVDPFLSFGEGLGDSLAVKSAPDVPEVPSAVSLEVSAGAQPQPVFSRPQRGAKLGIQSSAFADVRRRLQQQSAAAAATASAGQSIDVTVEQPRPFEGMSFSFAESDPMNAGELLRLIPAETAPDGTLTLSREMKSGLREEVRSWVENLRKRDAMAASELRSNTPRDEAIEVLGNRVLAQAAKSKTGVWSAALPNGRQLALVKSEIFNAVGIDVLVRAIHHQAIRVAMEQGDRYNEDALRAYKAPQPGMASAGGY